MIKNLDGIHETVSYPNEMEICLYNNTQAEDYPPHWHLPFELIMPTENSYRAVCGKREYLIRESDILIICPGILHALYAPKSGERIIFQASLSPVSIRELDVLTSIISPAALITPEKTPKLHAKIHALMLEIQKEYARQLPYSGTQVYALFLQILSEVGRSQATIIQQNFDAKSSKQKEYMDKFLFVTKYINEHFTEDLTLEQMASLAGFSKYHFTRLFQKYAGTTFYKYLNQKRIAHAKNLLLDPSVSVTDAALRSGFTSISAFLRMFRLTNNCTPTEFRKMYD
jgi:AraC-like DNA-binding protein